jgi:hypothetical protein
MRSAPFVHRIQRRLPKAITCSANCEIRVEKVSSYSKDVGSNIAAKANENAAFGDPRYSTDLRSLEIDHPLKDLKED